MSPSPHGTSLQDLTVSFQSPEQQQQKDCGHQFTDPLVPLPFPVQPLVSLILKAFPILLPPKVLPGCGNHMLGWYPREDQILSGPLSTSPPKEGPWARVGGAALSFKIYRFKQQKWSQGCVGDPRHLFLCAMLCGRLQLRASLKREAQRLRAKAGLVNTQAHKRLSDPQVARTSSEFPMSFPSS